MSVDDCVQFVPDHFDLNAREQGRFWKEENCAEYMKIYVRIFPF